MAVAVEDLVNQALVAVGWQRPIGDIYEGSPASRAALELYGQTRDALLARQDRAFALREVLLVANGQIPPSPWSYEYAYPADCLRIRTVRPGPVTGGVRSTDPRPLLYQPYNDQRPTPPVRAILAENAVAVLVYTARVTNPALWDATFTEELIAFLARQLALKLAQAIERQKMLIALAEQARTGTDAADDLRPAMLPTMPMMPSPAADAGR